MPSLLLYLQFLQRDILQQQFKKNGKNRIAVQHTGGQICKSVLSCTGIKHSIASVYVIVQLRL